MYVRLYVINRPRSVRMRPRATRKRSRPCLFRSLRSPTNALHSPSYYKAYIYLLHTAIAAYNSTITYTSKSQEQNMSAVHASGIHDHVTSLNGQRCNTPPCFLWLRSYLVCQDLQQSTRASAKVVSRLTECR